MESCAAHPEKILVVDDEPHMVAMITDALRNGGYPNVIATSDATEVIHAYERESPDLVILDMKMPGLNGLQILERLHPLVENDEYLPILVITGDRRIEVKLRALILGAKDFLPKPFEIDELMLRVRLLLETRALFHRVSRARAAPR